MSYIWRENTANTSISQCQFRLVNFVQYKSHSNADRLKVKFVNEIERQEFNTWGINVTLFKNIILQFY